MPREPDLPADSIGSRWFEFVVMAIFAGFALLLWWRMVRDEARGNPFDEAAVAGRAGDGRSDDPPTV